MADHTFGPFIALDPTQQPKIAQSASGKVYAKADTGHITPLEMRDLSGVTLDGAESDAAGLVQAIVVTDHSEVVWVSGNYTVPLRSFGGVLDQATAAAVAAQESATAAGLAQVSAEAAQQAVEDLLAGGGGGVTAHSALSGLSNDDHPQYFNQARGDARYYTQGQVDTKINQSATANSAGDRARGNHTGEQALSTVTGLVPALSGRIAYVLVSTGTEPRPTGAGLVQWVGGATQPTNMAITDIWLSDAGSNPGNDTSPPSVPTGLAVSGLSATGATVTWNPSSDNVGVTGYEVFLDGVSAATPAGTSANLTTLTPETAYSVTVRARDAVPNWSAQSTPVVFNTPPTVLPDLHSIFASTARTLDVISDVTPIVATAFYTFSTSANGWRNVGGRVYIPAGVVLPASIAVSAWTGTNPDLAVAPDRTATIATPAAGWNEILWGVPLTMTPSSPVWIGYEWSDGRYLSAAPPNGDPLQSVTTPFLYRAGAGDFAGVSRRRIGTGSTLGASDVWGCDILVDEGA